MGDGGLGKTFEIEQTSEDEGFNLITQNATLQQTIEKLIVLHDVGGCPTEIVGLDAMFDYLIVKQPLAQPHQNLEQDRIDALSLMKAIPNKAKFRRQSWILWENDASWLISDLHTGNIMRDAQDQPTIIDALLAPLPPELVRSNRLLSEHVEDARDLRLGHARPRRKGFDDVNDDDL